MVQEVVAQSPSGQKVDAKLYRADLVRHLIKEFVMMFLKSHCFVKARHIRGDKSISVGLFAHGREQVAIVVAGITLTVPSSPDHKSVVVKNYSESEGALFDLLDAEVLVGHPIGSVRSGFVNMPIYRLGAEVVSLVEAEMALIARAKYRK